MKKGLILMGVLMLCAGALAGCGKPSGEPTPSESETTVESVAIGPRAGTIYLDSEDKTLQLTVYVLPEDAPNKKYTLVSNKPSVATVSETGLVTGISAGEAIITATTEDGGKTARSIITVKQSSVEDSRLDQLHEPSFYASYKTNTNNLDKVNNIQNNSNVSRSFYYENEKGGRDTYKVGQQNTFVAKVTGVITDALTGNDTELANPDVNITLEQYDNATSDYVEISSEDVVNHVVISDDSKYDFKEAAIGNTYRITVSPDEVKYGSISEECGDVVMEVEVVDAYNVYNKKELSLFDNREGVYDDIKAELGIENVEVNGLVFHGNHTITNEDIPAEFRYTEEEVDNYIANNGTDFQNWLLAKTTTTGVTWTPEMGRETLVDSLKDYVDVYKRYTRPETDFRVEGNYFHIDCSQIKQVYAFFDDISEGKVAEQYAPSDPTKGCDGSHSTLFTANGDFLEFSNDEIEQNNYGGGKVSFTNITITGNGNRSNDDKYMGGLLTFKTRNVDFYGTGIITSRSFTTFIPCLETKEEFKTRTYLDRCKCFDSYSTLFYIYGTSVNVITNSWMSGAGGSIALLDEVGADDKNSPEKGTPNVDCYNVSFSNPVTGLEPWFVAHRATPILQMLTAFGTENGWLGKNAKNNGDHKNLTFKGSDDIPYIDLIAIDVCVANPLTNKLSNGGTMLKGGFHIYNNETDKALLGALDMAKLAACDPTSDMATFATGAVTEFMQNGNPLPLYRLMAMSAGSPGIIAQTVGGHGMLTDGSTFANGCVMAINDPEHAFTTVPLNEQISLTPISFFNTDGSEIAASLAAYKPNMDALASDDYMSIYLQPGDPTAEYIGVMTKLV